MKIINHRLYLFINKFILLFFNILFINCGGSAPPSVVVKPGVPVEIKPVIKKPVEVVSLRPQLPSSISIISIDYDLQDMKIIWNKAKDTNFVSYTLYQYLDSPDKAEVLEIFKFINDTTYALQNFNPTIKNNFFILNENKYGLKTKGESSSNEIEQIRPHETILLEMVYSEDLFIKWMMNRDYDFDHYEILKFDQITMEQPIVVKKIFNREDTSLVIPMNKVFFYQIKTRDKWGLESTSNIVKGDIIVNALGKQFSLIETKVIDLSYKNITGEIPNDISILRNLTVLKLNNNFLTGPIPSFIYSMKNLEFINLSHNSLSGPISHEIGLLSNLKELWIAENYFSGELPIQIGYLKNLTYLNICKNKLKGTIPETIGSLNKLRYLNGWDNNFIGFLPSTLGNLENLEFLSFGSNSLEGEIPPELGNAKKLKSIALFENNFIGPIPQEISKLPDLKYLSLFDNELDGFVPDSFFKKGSLNYLKLNKNNFSDLNHNLICTSGYDWNNYIFFDISNNHLPEQNNKCRHGITFHKIYNSY